MDYYRRFPEKEVTGLYQEVKKKPFVALLVRHLAWYYFYIHKAKESLRQSICKKLGIKVQMTIGTGKHAKRLVG